MKLSKPFDISSKTGGMFPVTIINSTGGGIAATITKSYHKGAGTRNGEEREFIVYVLKEVNKCQKNDTVSGV